MTIDDELESMRPKVWVPYGNHIWFRQDDYEALEGFARGQAERLVAIEAENARLRAALLDFREQDLDDGPCWCLTPTMHATGGGCSDLRALASVPGATGESAED